MVDDSAPRVYLLLDCDIIVSAHATPASAEVARRVYTDAVRAELGASWTAFVDEHIVTMPIDVQD